MCYLFPREMGEPKRLFFVLIWCLGTVHGSQQSCKKPKLDQGYFDSDEETYPHGTELYYACDKGLKPVVEGWWAITKCENSIWSPPPLCIDKKNCVAPDNPNAKVRNPDVKGWYPNERTVRFDCDEFYEIKGSIAAKCDYGTWTQLPPCVERDNLCGKPPQVTNAVITQKYQDKFTDGFIVYYKCQNSYTLDGTESIVCQSGEWTFPPTCIQTPSPTERASTGEGGHSTSSEGGHSTSSGGGHSTSSRGGHSTSSGGGHSTSSGGGHSTSSGDEASHNARPIAKPQPSGQFLPVDRCGEKPTVENGDFISDPESNRMSLTYKCINYYKLVGPEQVMCYSDQTWSELPICKAPCTVGKFTFDLLDLTRDMFVKEGESQTFPCKEQDYYGNAFVAGVRCQNGQVTVDRCTVGCKLDRRNLHWLDLPQDMFIKDRFQKWNCKRKDSQGRPLVADVRCQNGYLTSTGCYQIN